METEFYICEFCQEKFKPKRRKVQKFCSSTCRVKNHHHKNKVKKPISIASTIPEIETEVLEKPGKLKVEEMSAAGVGNTIVGNLATDVIKYGTKLAFTPKEDYPATKEDIQELKNLINTRYFKVNNVDPRYDGAMPYFDKLTGNVIYRGGSLNPALSTI